MPVLYMLTSNDRHQPALTSIYKTCNYFILVSWNQTMNMTTSKGSWALGQGIVPRNNIYKFLGTFLGQLLGQGPKDFEMLSPWWFESNWPALSRCQSYICWPSLTLIDPHWWLHTGQFDSNHQHDNISRSLGPWSWNCPRKVPKKL